MPITANIYYYQYQQNNINTPPIVLIHGAGGSHLSWPPEIRRLSDHRVFAIDLPGHGKSEGRGHQSIEAYTQSILVWMEAMGFHQAIFIGHSMGGAICLSLALNNTEQVRGVGIVSSGARLGVAPGILESAANPQTLPSALSAIASLIFSENANTRVVELVSKRMAETRPSVMHSDLLACNNFDILENISTIRTPTLVICGQEDLMTPLRYSQYLADHIPNAMIKIISDAGHMVMLEQSVGVASALSDFIATIPYHPGKSIRRSTH